MAENEKIDAKEVAEIIGMSASFVYANKDIIPHYRMGRKVVFDRKKIIAWYNDCHHEGEPCTLNDDKDN